MREWSRTLNAAAAERCTCGEDWSDQGKLIKAVIVLLLVVPLILWATSLAGWERFQAARRLIGVRAQVTATHAEQDRDERYKARVQVRYELGGLERRAGLYEDDSRGPGGGSKRPREARAFLAAHPVGCWTTVLVDPEDPARPRWRSGVDGWIPCFWLVSLGMIAIAIDMLSEVFARRMRHVGCERARSDAARVTLDHRDALLRVRWCGPRSGLRSFLIFGVPGVAAWHAGFTWPGLIGVALVAPLPLITALRLLMELRVFHRWRGVRLEGGDVAFAPGRSLELLLQDPRQRLDPSLARGAQLELRAERREELEDDCVWLGTSAQIAEFEVRGRGDGALALHATLPEDARWPRWSRERRERWVVALGPAEQRVYFELEFAPVIPAEQGEDDAEPLEDAWLPPAPEARRLLEACGERLGPPPRRLLAWRHRVRFSLWDRVLEDERRRAHRDRWLLLREGQLVWGLVLQTSVLDARELRADVVYLLGGRLDLAPGDRLHDLARGAWRLAAAVDTPADRLSQLLAAGVPVRGERLHTELAGDAPLFVSSLRIPRGDLPAADLASPFLPLLVAPDRTHGAVLLPAPLWAPELITRWKG